jgi:hypothetical protein
MSFVIAAPDMVASAAQNVAGIDSSLSAANTAAAAPTTGVLAPVLMRCQWLLRRCFPGRDRPFRRSALRRRRFIPSSCRH